MTPVRLIGPDGEQIGIVPIKEALDRAHDVDLDLVEVSPNSRPPVCRILDYGKYKYELSKKDRLAKKRQHSVQLKEMRFRPKTDEHDYQFKSKHVREFLKAGSKVRAFVMFRGRELAYTDRGKRLLDRVAEDMADIAIVDVPAKREGRHMSMILGPRPEVLKMLKQVRDDEESDSRREERQEEKSEQAAPDQVATEAETKTEAESAGSGSDN